MDSLNDWNSTLLMGDLGSSLACHLEMAGAFSNSVADDNGTTGRDKARARGLLAWIVEQLT